MFWQQDANILIIVSSPGKKQGCVRMVSAVNISLMQIGEKAVSFWQPLKGYTKK